MRPPLVFEEAQDSFTSAAPNTPDSASLAAELPPAAVLGRACQQTLALSPGCDRSAAELTRELPCLGVAHSGTRPTIDWVGVPSGRFA